MPTAERTPPQLVNPSQLGWFCVALLTIPVLAFPGTFAWLTWRPVVSMRELRGVEWVLVLTTLLPLLVQRHASVSAAMALPTEEAGTQAMAGRFATAYCNFPCTAMIIVYGMFVPNTYRRTVLMLSILAAGILLTDFLAWLPYLPQPGPAFTDAAFQTGAMLFLSLGAAFYGSFKVGALRFPSRAPWPTMPGTWRLSYPWRSVLMPDPFLVLRASLLGPVVRLGWGAIFGPLVW